MFLQRFDKQAERTFGELFTKDGVKLCDTLEDTDRGLTSQMSEEQVRAVKVYGRTAIPTGCYKVFEFYSPKFKKNTLRLEGVVGFTGILIHAGNTERDTLGCILLGRRHGNMLVNSREAVERVEVYFRASGDNRLVVK